MDLNQFILAFFASKNLSLLTAFLCWDPGELVRFWHEMREGGARVLVRRDFATTALPPDATYREGVLLDLSCPDAALVLQEASSSRAFNLRYAWLVLADVNRTEEQAALDEAEILPDGDVTWASPDGLVDLYRTKPGQAMVVSPLGEGLNATRQELDALWARLPTTVSRRKNLQNIRLKTAVILSQPQHFKGWTELAGRQIDTFPKVTYPIMNLVAEDLNYRQNMAQVSLYGEERNGSFDGLAGRLQRRQAEIGVASMFLRKDRWRVLHFVAQTVEFKSAFIFRQPTQASVRNVFLAPFSRGVWAAAAALAAAAAALLASAARPAQLRRSDAALAFITPAESFTFAVGTICQQGSPVSASLVSVRLIMFSTLLLALFAFTAYSAKIVSILQAPSDAIRTIDDLARSPLDCGVQDTTYKMVYFQESTDPATQRLYRKKLLPRGDAAILSVVEGIRRVRTGLFAFQVEESPGYDIVSQTYTNREKCGLAQVQAFKPPAVAVPIRKYSGYRDLLAARLRWQRECGLMARWRRVWLAERPGCDAAGADFATVSIRDVFPCVQVLCGGALLAAALLVLEKLTHALRTRRRPVVKRHNNVAEPNRARPC